MEALKTFGVTENTKNMLVVKVSSDDVNSVSDGPHDMLTRADPSASSEDS